MPEYKEKDHSFKLWKNKYKKDGDKKPDYTGTGIFDGTKRDVSLWINQDKNGNRYLAGQTKEPYKKSDSPF
tara:strand:- start:3742 stop:3954 length:213 start_codon:yes stop_codon:yes gene_type:complete